jgi:ubiquinone/menaquinone biosynthesis methyltransferase
MTFDGDAASRNAAGFQPQQDAVFDRIATRYDVLCDLFSFGIHRQWKRRVAKLIAQEPWRNLLDAATGTGDVVLRVASTQNTGRAHHIIASDISPQMLAIAAKRAASADAIIEFQLLDAHAMPEIPDASIDLYSISLGLKICERDQVLREAHRVLRPGGRLVILEASNISSRWLHRIYLRYMELSMPFIGWLATGGDASAYQYLLKGIRQFPSAEELASEIARIGFEDVTFRRLSLGIVATHLARKTGG